MKGDHTESWGISIILAVIVGAYFISFFLPVTDAGTPRAMYGYEAFFWGLVSVVYLPMWLANPALCIGCVYYHEGRWRAARNAGLLAVVLAASEVWFWDDRPEIGYYLWIGSMMLLTLAGTVQSIQGTAPNDPL